MFKYICLECRYEFDEPGTDIENYGQGLLARSHVCPNCGGTYDDATECDECGESIGRSEARKITIDGKEKTVCDKCYDELEDDY